MKNLTNEELKEISGGGFHFGILAGIVAGVSFIIGVIDGLVRPLKCNY